MNNTMIYKILRWLTVLLVIVFLASYGSEEETIVSKATFADIEAAVAEQVDMAVMQRGESDKLERFYGLNAADFAGCALFYPIDFMSVEEILIIELSDPAQEQTVRDSIEARLNRQKETFDGYGSDGQYEKLCNNARIEVRGNFLLFTVNCETAVQTFLSVA